MTIESLVNVYMIEEREKERMAELISESIGGSLESLAELVGFMWRMGWAEGIEEIWKFD